jgi:hypothetical protein
VVVVQSGASRRGRSALALPWRAGGYTPAVEVDEDGRVRKRLVLDPERQPSCPSSHDGAPAWGRLTGRTAADGVVSWGTGAKCRSAAICASRRSARPVDG